MIAKIKGVIEEIYIDGTVIDVSGVGYFLFLTNYTLTTLSAGQKVSFYTFHALRENASDLYGFNSQEELYFFKLLISISGIGPKSALGILNTAPIETIKEGIKTGDASYLTKVSGIGKKSAEKIIVELKDKLGMMDENNRSKVIGSGDAIEALTALGYSLGEAREAIQRIENKNLPTEEIVKKALKNLN
jgi:holliday junction DNA helicase RuvA